MIAASMLTTFQQHNKFVIAAGAVVACGLEQENHTAIMCYWGFFLVHFHSWMCFAWTLSFRLGNSFKKEKKLVGSGCELSVCV